MNKSELFEEWWQSFAKPPTPFTPAWREEEYNADRRLALKTWNHQQSKIDIAIGMMQIALDQKEAAERSLVLAEKVVAAARANLQWFYRLREDHDKKLGQSMEEAFKNWDSISQEKFDYQPLMDALRDYDAAKKENSK